MHLHNENKFVKHVLSKVKFAYDHEKIKQELHSHIEDHREELIEKGYSLNEAAEKSVISMGDPYEIGRALNKEHSPIIGWIYLVSKVFLIIMIIFGIFHLSFPIGSLLFNHKPIKDIEGKNIVWHVKVDETRIIDDSKITVSDLIYTKDGKLNVFYSIRTAKFLGQGWSHSSIGTFTDEKGEEYIGSSYLGGGIIGYGVYHLRDFPKDAKMLNIDYDNYNRKYEIEIELGGKDE